MSSIMVPNSRPRTIGPSAQEPLNGMATGDRNMQQRSKVATVEALLGRKLNI
jgi:hypothetical protein